MTFPDALRIAHATGLRIRRAGWILAEVEPFDGGFRRIRNGVYMSWTPTPEERAATDWQMATVTT